MESLDALIRGAVGEELSREEVDALATTLGYDRTATFNAIMVRLAELFLEGELAFWDADDVANAVWPLMLDDAIERDVALPSPAFEIYEAFDAGEWDHGDPARNPVERFTRPLLREVVDAQRTESDGTAR